MIKLFDQTVFFDLETTGVDTAKDRIVQISAIKLDENFCIIDRKTRLINPTIPIPAEAEGVHGISDEMVKDEPTFNRVAKGIFDFFGNCDLAGYNIASFDLPLLVEEFLRAGLDIAGWSPPVIDAMTIFKRHEERTLAAALRFYTGKEMDEKMAHDAEYDTMSTIEVLKAQMELYSDLPDTPEEFTLYSNNDNKIIDFAGKLAYDDDGDAVYNIGKDKGSKVKFNPGFGEWMLGKDFPRDTKSHLRKILPSRGVY